MNNSELIREFISKNPGTTEYKVAKYMAENHYCARDTAHNLIYNTLIPAGKILDEKIGNSFHRLYINNEDEFNVLMASIENTERLVDRFNDAALADIDKFNEVRGVWMKNKDLVNMIHFQQAWHHGIMIKIALLINSSINNVKDRETLYLRFINVLIAANRLDVSAALRGGVHAIVEKVKIVNRQSHPGRSKTANYIIHFSSKIKEIESDLEKMWQNKPKEKEQKLPHPIIVKAFKDGVLKIT